ncbi:Hypothetical predicted protein, partial [Pelobates cultripes]
LPIWEGLSKPSPRYEDDSHCQSRRWASHCPQRATSLSCLHLPGIGSIQLFTVTSLRPRAAELAENGLGYTGRLPVSLK